MESHLWLCRELCAAIDQGRRCPEEPSYVLIRGSNRASTWFGRGQGVEFDGYDGGFSAEFLGELLIALSQRDREGQAGSAEHVTRTKPWTNDPNSARLSQTSPDIRAALNCGNRT